VELTRKENRDSTQVLAQRGIQIVEPDDSARAELSRIATQVSQDLAGKQYPKEMLDEVLKTLSDMRGQK
jgi:TRAP-type C4-dicarboxylate transport system substrate-binding protein